MSREFNIAESDGFFRGEVKTLIADIDDGDDTPVDVSSYTLEYKMKLRADAVAAATVEKSSADSAEIEVVNSPAAPDGNGGAGARVKIKFLRINTVNIVPASFQHALARTDAGSEAILFYGSIVIRETVAD